MCEGLGKVLNECVCVYMFVGGCVGRGCMVGRLCEYWHKAVYVGSYCGLECACIGTLGCLRRSKTHF